MNEGSAGTQWRSIENNCDTKCNVYKGRKSQNKSRVVQKLWNITKGVGEEKKDNTPLVKC